MAGFTRVNGDASQVAVYDAAGYVNGTTTGSVAVPIQPQGPKLMFLVGDLGADPTGQFGVGGAIEAVLKVVQELTTVYMYQFNADGTYRMGVYPISTDITTGWQTSTLQAAIRALGTVNAYNLAGATCAEGGLA